MASFRRTSIKISRANENTLFFRWSLISSRSLESCGVIILKIASRVIFVVRIGSRWWEISANRFYRRRTSLWRRLFYTWLFSISYILILKLVLILILVFSILCRERTRRWFRSGLAIIRVIRTRIGKRIRNRSRRRI